MNLRWLWLDHVPHGVELMRGERQEIRSRARRLRSEHPSTMHKHGALLGAIVAWSLLEAILLLFVVLYVFPMAAAAGVRFTVIIGLPVLICLPFWIMLALAFNRSHSPFVWRALNELGHGVCTKCGYALRGLTKDVRHCPECGAAREPAPAQSNE